MPRRSPELPLRRFRAPLTGTAVLALAASALWAPPARAQEADARVGLLLEAGVRATPVAGRTSLLPGGLVLLSLTPSLAVGGGGWATPTAVRTRAEGFDVAFGYGGLVLHFLHDTGARPTLGARLLVGGGNVLVRDRVVGTEMDSDNAFVFEPELTAGLPIHPRVQALVSAGWRVAVGADPLPAARVGGLGGWGLALSLSVGPF